MKRRLLQRDVLSGILLLGLSGTLWVLSAEFPSPDDGYPGSALFPRVIGVFIGTMGLWLIFKALRTPWSAPKKTTCTGRIGNDPFGCSHWSCSQLPVARQQRPFCTGNGSAYRNFWFFTQKQSVACPSYRHTECLLDLYLIYPLTWGSSLNLIKRDRPVAFNSV